MATLLSINNYFYRRGGAEALFLEQNRMLAQSGWEVVPFAMQHENNLDSPYQPYFVQEIEYGKPAPLLRKIGNAQKILYSFEARRRVAQLIALTRPDIAHAHNVYHHLSPSIFSLIRDQGIPTLMTLHDLKIACPAYKMLNDGGVCERCRDGALWQVAAQRCIKGSRMLSLLVMAESALHRLLGCYSKSVDRFIVPSRFYIDKLVQWGWQRERFSYLPNFIDTDALRPSGVEPGDAFVYVGRLGPEKGISTFIRAAAQAGVPAWIVGVGPEEASLRRLVQETGADATFHGYRSGTELAALIGAARALVLPSEWYENAPISVMEAYALGRPVIGADIGGIPELIHEGETGALFPSGDVEALAAQLRRFSRLRDAEIVDMGRSARALAERDYSAERYCLGLLDIYRDMGVAA